MYISYIFLQIFFYILVKVGFSKHTYSFQKNTHLGHQEWNS